MISFALFVSMSFAVMAIGPCVSFAEDSSELEAASPKPKLSKQTSKISDVDLGQLLILGFKGTSINEGLGDVIKESKPGAILFFARNVRGAQQVAELNIAAQALAMKVSGKPLLIGIDQEGGNVIRIKHSPPLPSALAIARTNDLDVAKKAGTATGRLLRALGLNMNLAPVVDVADPDQDEFLGTRSFGKDPKSVAAMVTAVSQGLQSQGILPIAKHFPGHGETSADSHFSKATSDANREQLESRDLVPYASLAKNLEKPWGAMLAHVGFPKIDETGVPATFSKPIIQDLLRQGIDANLLVMTDDIEMAGAGAETDIGMRAVRAIEAGADMVMIAWSRNVQRQVLRALRKAVDDGRLKESRIREAIARIAAAKKIYANAKKKLPTADEMTASVRNPAFNEIGDAILRSLPKRHMDRFPATDGGQRAGFRPVEQRPDPIILFTSRKDFADGFQRRAKGFKVKTMMIRPSQKEDVERLLRKNPDSVAFAYVSGRQVAAFFSGLDDALASRVIIINVETRAAIRDPERFRDIFEVHYRHPRLGEVVADTFLARQSAATLSF